MNVVEFKRQYPDLKCVKRYRRRSALIRWKYAILMAFGFPEAEERFVAEKHRLIDILDSELSSEARFG